MTTRKSKKTTVQTANTAKSPTKLSIGGERTCDCAANHINCLTAKEWMLSQIAIQEFFYEKRDIRDKKKHPATFPIALATHFIKLFTHRGELVLDPFVGSGTTLVAAQDLERNAVGFDLKQEYVDLAQARIAQPRLTDFTEETTTQQVAICANAKHIADYLEPESVTFCITSPPYANMLNRKRLNKSLRGNLRKNEHYLTVQQYSDDPEDLGTMDTAQYVKTLGMIFKGIRPLLRPKAHCVINITDLWWKNQRLPIHVDTIKEMERVGYELRNVIIWDRRNLVNRAGIFGWPNNFITLSTTFEYLLDFLL
ncbi:MAG: DNA methyltransferase [Candidatus Hodarchaeota archaeon]